eukprot:44606-Prorocentrum_minimum.AAC.1
MPMRHPRGQPAPPFTAFLRRSNGTPRLLFVCVTSLCHLAARAERSPRTRIGGKATPAARHLPSCAIRLHAIVTHALS